MRLPVVQYPARFVKFQRAVAIFRPSDVPLAALANHIESN
jgi:hypothetical protein